MFTTNRQTNKNIISVAEVTRTFRIPTIITIVITMITIIMKAVTTIVTVVTITKAIIISIIIQIAVKIAKQQTLMKKSQAQEFGLTQRIPIRPTI